MGKIVIYVLFFFAASISGEQSEGSKMVGHSGMLFGRNITIGTIRDLPYVDYEIQDNTKVINIIGFVPMMVAWWAEKYHFNYEYIEPPDYSYGGFENDTWNGLVGMLIRNEIDLIATDLSITSKRSSVIEFTYPYSNDPISLVIPYPQLDSTLHGLTRPFKYEVWAGVVTSIFVGTFLFRLFNKIQDKLLSVRGEEGFTELSWMFFRAFAHPDSIPNLTTPTQLFLAGWCLAAFVLVQSYSSCLASYLLAPKLIPFINSIEDFANNDNMELIVFKYSSMEATLMSATTGVLAKLGNKLRAHPENSVGSDFPDYVIADQKKSSAYARSVIDYYAYKDFKETGQCRSTSFKENLFDDILGIALPDSSTLEKQFSIDIMIMQQSGLLQYWREQYTPKSNRCFAQLITLRPDTNNEKLTLDFLSSSFLLYGIGVTISMFTFIIESVLTYVGGRKITEAKV